MAATGIDLQRLESRIVTLQLANAVKRIHERLGMKSEVNDGTLPLSLLSLRQPGASDSLIMELIAQQVANAGASSNATNCTSTAAAVMPTPAVISIDPEVQASQTMLELLQMWRAERDSQKAVNDNFQAKLKELEEVQAKRSADRKARLEEIQKKINELKPKS